MTQIAMKQFRYKKDGILFSNEQYLFDSIKASIQSFLEGNEREKYVEMILTVTINK